MELFGRAGLGWAGLIRGRWRVLTMAGLGMYGAALIIAWRGCGRLGGVLCGLYNLLGWRLSVEVRIR